VSNSSTAEEDISNLCPLHLVHIHRVTVT